MSDTRLPRTSDGVLPAELRQLEQEVAPGYVQIYAARELVELRQRVQAAEAALAESHRETVRTIKERDGLVAANGALGEALGLERVRSGHLTLENAQRVSQLETLARECTRLRVQLRRVSADDGSAGPGHIH